MGMIWLASQNVTTKVSLLYVSNILFSKLINLQSDKLIYKIIFLLALAQLPWYCDSSTHD